MHVATGVDDSQGTKRCEVAHRGNADRDIANREREKIKEEDEEVAGFAVGVFGVGRHATWSIIVQPSLCKPVRDSHGSNRRDKPRQERYRADLRHIRRQHDDTGPHHIHSNHEGELHQRHFFGLRFHYRSPYAPSFALLLDHVRVEFYSAVHALLEHALDLVVEAWEAVERLLEREEVIEHRLSALIPTLSGTTTPMPGG